LSSHTKSFGCSERSGRDAYGVDCLRIVGLRLLSTAYGMVLTQSFTARVTRGRDDHQPIVFWLWNCRWRTAGDRFSLRPRGVFLAITIASHAPVISAISLEEGSGR